MRLLLIALVLAASSAVPRAQGIYRAVGDTGLGVGASTTLSEGTALAAAGTVTVTPRFDATLAIGRADLGRRVATTVGVSGTLWLEADSPSRAGLSVGVNRLEADGRTAVLSGVSATVGRQLQQGPRTLIVPSLTAGVVLVSSDDFESGLQTSVAIDVQLVHDLGEGARVRIGPSASLGSETQSVSFGLSAGLLL